jgi:hypothetical protein
MSRSGGDESKPHGLPASESPARVAEAMRKIELALVQGLPLAEVEPQRPEFQRGEAGKDEG